MNPSFSLKSLPEPLQFWIRPMLLISLGLHGLLLATPMPSPPKHEAPKPKKEPEKVKITQLPPKPTSPAPKAAPPKPAAVAALPKPAPVVAPPTRPKPQPIRQAALEIPPVAPRPKVIPLPKPQPEQKKPLPTPEQTPPSPTAQQTPPSPSEQAPPTPAPTPESAVKDPFADFPFPTNVQPGSLGVLPGDTDKAARNTADGLEQVVTFYNQELPAKKFNPKPLTNEADLKIYEVSKEGGTPQYLHLISKDGKTVILLASQVTDLKSLKNSEARSAEEVMFYDNVLKPLENDEKLFLSSVDSSDTDKIPSAAQFADTNKFQFRAKTGKLAPKSPDELYAIYEAQLSRNGFTQISKEAPYGGANVYKVTQGKFTTYMYFVVNTDNSTIVILSKDPPSS